jgi:hypothetical protein
MSWCAVVALGCGDDRLPLRDVGGERGSGARDGGTTGSSGGGGASRTGTGGAPGSGGAGRGGGAGGVGGSVVGMAGATGTGGAATGGTSVGSGGTPGTGGAAVGAAGSIGTAGVSGSGGMAGSIGTGGVVGTGGVIGTAGVVGTAGAVGTSGIAGMAGSGIGGTGGVVPPAAGPPCEDIFSQTLQTFSLELTPEEWASLQHEFTSVGMLSPSDFAAYDPIYHPAIVRYGNEVVNDAFVRLKGESSWRLAVMLDGDRAKMQFVVAFDQLNKDAEFHGLGKIAFDMPRNDKTFLHDRLSHAWMRSIGIPALCVTSARVNINGSFYGLYSVQERVGKHFIKEFFPGNAGGDLFESGSSPETNKDNPDWARLSTFWQVMTPAQLAAIVDVPTSLLEWAAEAMLNDGDGYWGGAHNFYIYDQGVKGYVWLPDDMDATFDFLGNFTGHPMYWWSTRSGRKEVGQHYQVVMRDPTLRAQYVQALATQFSRFDAAQIQSWIDAWSAQVRDSAAADPHGPATTTVAAFDAAVALARRGVAERASYVGQWLQCMNSNSGEDKDGDGIIWCQDCRDDNNSVHPGAPEMCGNDVDENCNGLYDEGCPAALLQYSEAAERDHRFLGGAVP